MYFVHFKNPQSILLCRCTRLKASVTLHVGKRSSNKSQEEDFNSSTKNIMEENFIKKSIANQNLSLFIIYTLQRRLAQLLQHFITIIIVELSVLRQVCKLKCLSLETQDVMSTLR